MSKIDLFGEVERQRSYLHDRNAVEMPSPMEDGGDDKARITSLEQQVRRFQEFIEAQNAVEIPEGPELDRSYEFAPGDDKPIIAADGIQVIDTGREVLVQAVAGAGEAGTAQINGTSLPVGTENYQVLVWDNDDSLWKADWVRAHA